MIVIVIGLGWVGCYIKIVVLGRARTHVLGNPIASGRNAPQNKN